MQQVLPFLQSYINKKSNFPNSKDSIDFALVFSQEFKASMLPELFIGFSQWEGRQVFEYKYSDMYASVWDCYFTFTSTKMILNKKNIEGLLDCRLPTTLDEFISDCNRMGIKLYWNVEIITE